MTTRFSGDVGYRGIVKLNDVILLATSGNFTINHEPIFSTGVWGAGYANAAENVAYANNYLGVSGSIGFELTKGGGIGALNTFAFTNRGAAAGTPILIYPNGEYGLNSFAWCSGFSLETSQDSIVTGSSDFTSYIREDELGNISGITTGINSNSTTGASLGVLPMSFNDLYPYWASKVYVSWDSVANAGLDLNSENTDGSLKDIVEWSSSYSSSIEVLKCCDGQIEDPNYGKSIVDGQDAPLAPDYILLGPMTGECSFTVFRLKDGFYPEIFHSARGAKFMFAPSSDLGVYDEMEIAKMVVNSADTQIQTGATYVQASYNFTAIGDGAGAPVQLNVASRS